jgi:hypothetical protein
MAEYECKDYHSNLVKKNIVTNQLLFFGIVISVGGDGVTVNHTSHRHPQAVSRLGVF